MKTLENGLNALKLNIGALKIGMLKFQALNEHGIKLPKAMLFHSILSIPQANPLPSPRKNAFISILNFVVPIFINVKINIKLLFVGIFCKVL